MVERWVLAIMFITAAITCAPVHAQTAVEKAALCASCHSGNGRPADPTVPIIWGLSEPYLTKQLQDYRNGARDSQIMSSIAESLGSDLEAVAAFFAQQPWPSSATSVSTDQQVTSVVSACQSCHGVGFGGGTVNGEVAPRLRGQSAPYTQQTLVAMTSGERANNDTMTVIAKSLDGAQIEPIAQYLAALGN